MNNKLHGETFTLTIEMHGAAFGEPYDDATEYEAHWELSRLLRKAADRVEDGLTSGSLLDINGHTCGTFTIGEDA